MKISADCFIVSSLKPDCFFPTTYWKQLSANSPDLQFIAIIGNGGAAHGILQPHIMRRTNDVVFCSASVFADKSANNALRALTWYGSQFKVIYATQSQTCFAPVLSCYEIEADVTPIGDLVSEARNEISFVATLTPTESMHLWCFSQDADICVTRMPLEEDVSRIISMGRIQSACPCVKKS